MRSTLYLLLLLLSLVSCRTGLEEATVESPVAPLEELPSPAGPGSGEPNLFVAEDGAAYLSWIEPLGDSTHALMFSVRRGGRWSGARRVAAGSDWFVNWADFPSLAVYPGGGLLAAHWLAKAPGGGRLRLQRADCPVGRRRK